MSIKRQACIVGAYEHPTRKAPDKTVAQLHAEVARGALLDAGLTINDVDGYFCAGDAPGLGALNIADHIGLHPRHVDSTDMGGSSYLAHVGHAAQAIAAGKCNVALITLAGRPRSEASSGTQPRNWGPNLPDQPFEARRSRGRGPRLPEAGQPLDEFARTLSGGADFLEVACDLRQAPVRPELGFGEL